MNFLPVPFVSTAPCLLHVAPCEERDPLSPLQPSCKYCYTVIKFPRRLPFPTQKRPILLCLSLILFLITDILSCQCRRLICSSQSCHKEFELTAIFSDYVLYPFFQLFWESISVLEFTIWIRAVSIISMTFPDLKERYLEKEEEMVTHLTRGTGDLCTPYAAA